MYFSLVAAVDKNFGIGIQNRLPWRLKNDLKYFSELTSKAAPGKVNAVIMGRKTWQSLPEKSKPLPDRVNVILSRHNVENFDPKTLNKKNTQHKSAGSEILSSTSLDDALQTLEKNAKIDKVFIIGGANVFEQAILHPSCQKIYLTEVNAEFECDTFFPRIPKSFIKKEESEIMKENELEFRFMVFEKL